MKKNILLLCFLICTGFIFAEDWYICLSSFKSKENADNLQMTLQKNGLPSFQESFEKSGSTYYRVFYDRPFVDKSDAKEKCVELERSPLFKKLKIKGLWVAYTNSFTPQKAEPAATNEVKNEEKITVKKEAAKENRKTEKNKTLSEKIKGREQKQKRPEPKEEKVIEEPKIPEPPVKEISEPETKEIKETNEITEEKEADSEPAAETENLEPEVKEIEAEPEAEKALEEKPVTEEAVKEIEEPLNAAENPEPEVKGIEEPVLKETEPAAEPEKIPEEIEAALEPENVLEEIKDVEKPEDKAEEVIAEEPVEETKASEPAVNEIEEQFDFENEVPVYYFDEQTNRVKLSEFILPLMQVCLEQLPYFANYEIENFWLNDMKAVDSKETDSSIKNTLEPVTEQFGFAPEAYLSVQYKNKFNSKKISLQIMESEMGIYDALQTEFLSEYPDAIITDYKVPYGIIKAYSGSDGENSILSGASTDGKLMLTLNAENIDTDELKQLFTFAYRKNAFDEYRKLDSFLKIIPEKKYSDETIIWLSFKDIDDSYKTKKDNSFWAEERVGKKCGTARLLMNSNLIHAECFIFDTPEDALINYYEFVELYEEDENEHNHAEAVNENEGWYLESEEENIKELSFVSDNLIISIAADLNSVITKEHLVNIALSLNMFKGKKKADTSTVNPVNSTSDNAVEEDFNIEDAEEIPEELPAEQPAENIEPEETDAVKAEETDENAESSEAAENVTEAEEIPEELPLNEAVEEKTEEVQVNGAVEEMPAAEEIPEMSDAETEAVQETESSEAYEEIQEESAGEIENADVIPQEPAPAVV